MPPNFEEVEGGILVWACPSVNLGPYAGNFCGKPHSNVWLTIGLACGIFRQSAYTQKTEKFSDFCASNQ